MTLDDLRRLGAAATPGPWRWHYPADRECSDVDYIEPYTDGSAGEGSRYSLISRDSGVYGPDIPTCEWIMAARAHWDALLAVAEAATDALDRHRYGYDAASDLATDRVAIALAALEAIR